MRYENPIIRGFNPDPSICRVGEDFYLATSSFEFFPGIPVYHSRDLVNWRQIGNCIERPEQLPMEIAGAGLGIWAPTIRWHEGLFYVTAKMKDFGNFIVWSADPATGWSDPVRVDIEGIDPSILFDGGKAYYTTNLRSPEGLESISMVEVDAKTGDKRSDVRAIWHGMADDRPQKLEAPHIYHIGDWYYLWAAEGGTAFEHMITAARSREIWGPYTSCDAPLLTNRYSEGTGVACSGHGDLVEDGRGNWWTVHLATRPDDRWYSHLGRETFLLPVTWEKEWPVIGDGVSHLVCDGPLTAAQQPLNPWQADFSSRQPQWLSVRRPVAAHYDFRGDRLALTPATEKLSDPLGSPAFLALRQMDIDCTVEARICFDPAFDQSEAGLSIYIADYGYYAFCKKRIDGRNSLMIYRQGGDFAPVSLPLADGEIKLRIQADKKHYTLSYALDGGEYVRAAVVPVLTKADAGKGFTGTLIGVYAQTDRAGEKPAEILSYRVFPA